MKKVRRPEKKAYRRFLIACLALFAVTSLLLLGVPGPGLSPLGIGAYRQLARVHPLQNSPTAERREAKIAFFIQTYEKTFHLVPSLLEAIWHPENIYAVHIDAKVKVKSKDVDNLNRALSHPKYKDNVYLIPSEPVTYLGITTLLNTVNAISFLLTKSSDWDYFINISGADYPMTSPKVLRSLLGDPVVVGEKISFVQMFGQSATLSNVAYDTLFSRMTVDKSLWTPFLTREGNSKNANTYAEGGYCERECLWNSEMFIEYHPLLDSTQGDLPIVKTEAWVILHRSFARFVVDSALSRRLLVLLGNIMCPEEHFFGTLLNLSEEFSGAASFDAFRSVFWTHKESESSASPPEVDSGHIKDVKELLLDSGSLFCRKRSKVRSEVREFIDKQLIGKEGESGMASSGAWKQAVKVQRRVQCAAQFRKRPGVRDAKYKLCMKS